MCATLADWIDQRSQRWQQGRADEVLKASPLQALTQALRELLDALERCDVSSTLRPLGWWRRLTGERVLNEVRLRVADREIAHLLARAQARADAQAAWELKWQDIVREHATWLQGLVERIRIEQKLLPSDPPDEREARALRLQNAQLVLASAQMTAQQFKLMQGRHDTVRARFDAIKFKLIPLWLDQLTAVLQGTALDGRHLASALKTYTALSEKLRAELSPAATEDMR